MLSSGNILHWPLHNLVKKNNDNPNIPLHYNLETFAGVIENKEPPWKNLVLSDSRIVFGLEMKFGDVKIFNWSKTVKRNTDVEEERRMRGCSRHQLLL